ncbi:MAG: hypothetical protein H8F28_15380 [Fibrella sp.]|nr:hypothetical protein [Armatimonadota bacterium]
MLSRRLLLSSLVPAFGLFSATTAHAQSDDTEPKPPLFEQLFPKPTGANGFEEIIRAGQRLSESKAAYPPAAEFTLDKRRAYLADPACREALVLFRQGIAKPLHLPAVNPLDTSVAQSQYFVLLMQSFALMRSLARLLAVDIYVALADGKNDAAIRTVADGLKLSYSFKGMSIIAGLVGNALDAILLTTLTQLRESWNAKDCSRLTRLAGQWLAAPNPIIAALSVERELSLRFLREMREDPQGVSEQLESHYAVDEEETETAQSREAETAATTLRTDAAVRERVFGEMSGVINEHYDKAFALVKNPTGRMSIDPTVETDANRHPITLMLRSVVLLSAPNIVQRSIEDRLQLQLLAVHAAIRGHRWHYARLPKTLDELKLPANIVADPFTAKPLLYEPESKGSGYTLASAGALVPGTDGKPDARDRVMLPREPRKP